MCHFSYLAKIIDSSLCTLNEYFDLNRITFPLLDPYVKVSLMCEGRRLKKRKTTTKKNTLNPVYNEAIIFDIPPENVDQVSLSIAVMDYDRCVWFLPSPWRVSKAGRMPTFHTAVPGFQL